MSDPRDAAAHAVTERFRFRCARCHCSANLTIAIPDAPAFEGGAPKRPRDALAPREPRKRARLLATLLPCPGCGARSIPRTTLHVLGTVLRAAFALALSGILAALALSDDLLIRQLAVAGGATLILSYGVIILGQDVGLLRARRDVSWTDILGAR